VPILKPDRPLGRPESVADRLALDLAGDQSVASLLVPLGRELDLLRYRIDPESEGDNPPESQATLGRSPHLSSEPEARLGAVATD